MYGPTVQDKLISILLCFQRYQFVIITDTDKIFRQIIVAEEDRDRYPENSLAIAIRCSSKTL